MTAEPSPRGAPPGANPGSSPRIGILSLETRFPRIPGDVGNPETYAFPVRIARVAGATPERVVLQRAEGMVEAFIAAGRQLASEGCAALVTTCGFLALHQQALADALPVPVATSALMQLPMIVSMLSKNSVVGVVTASERSLSAAHLRAVGADASTPIAGVAEGGAFSRTFVGNGDTLDVEAARAEVVAAALRLTSERPNLGAILLECANMGPYARDVQYATHLPVFDMVGLVNWLHHGLMQAGY